MAATAPLLRVPSQVALAPVPSEEDACLKSSERNMHPLLLRVNLGARRILRALEGDPGKPAWERALHIAVAVLVAVVCVAVVFGAVMEGRKRLDWGGEEAGGDKTMALEGLADENLGFRPLVSARELEPRVNRRRPIPKMAQEEEVVNPGVRPEWRARGGKPDQKGRTVREGEAWLRFTHVYYWGNALSCLSYFAARAVATKSMAWMRLESLGRWEQQAGMTLAMALAIKVMDNPHPSPSPSPKTLQTAGGPSRERHSRESHPLLASLGRVVFIRAP